MPDSTPALAIPYPLPGDAVIDYPTTGRELAELLEAHLPVPMTVAQFVAIANPTDGQLVALQAAPGVTWMLRYNAAAVSVYKWEFVGGPPLWATVEASEAVASSGAILDPATPGPQMQAPATGVYQARYAANFLGGGAGAFTAHLFVGAGGTSPPDTYVGAPAPAGGGGLGLSTMGQIPYAARGAFVKLQYAAAAGITAASVRMRRLELLPVRLSIAATLLRGDLEAELLPGPDDEPTPA